MAKRAYIHGTQNIGICVRDTKMVIENTDVNHKILRLKLKGISPIRLESKYCFFPV